MCSTTRAVNSQMRSKIPYAVKDVGRCDFIGWLFQLSDCKEVMGVAVCSILWRESVVCGASFRGVVHWTGAPRKITILTVSWGFPTSFRLPLARGGGVRTLSYYYRFHIVTNLVLVRKSWLAAVDLRIGKGLGSAPLKHYLRTLATDSHDYYNKFILCVLRLVQ